MSDLMKMSLTNHHVVAGPGVPPALGPYSPAVKVGNLVFVSAQSGVDPHTGRLPDGGFEQECRQAFDNVAKVLEAAGAHLGQVAKVTVLYAHREHLAIINAVYAAYFPVDPPARTTAMVQLAADRSIAVDAIAVISG